MDAGHCTDATAHFSRQSPHRLRWLSDCFLVLLVIGAGALSLRYHTRIGIHEGMGHDGLHYGQWAQDFRKKVLVDGVNAYRAHRVLPSAVVHLTMRLLRLTPTPTTVIRVFAIYNVLLLGVMAFLWCLIARSLALDERKKWLSALFLFVNFAFLQMPAYYPALTDVWAATLGMLMTYGYLANRSACIFVSLACCSFTWPAMQLEGLLLLAFPKRSLTLVAASSVPRWLPTTVAIAISGSIGLLAAWGIVSGFVPTNVALDSSVLMRIIGISIVVAGLFYGLRGLLGNADLLNPAHCWKQVNLRRALAGFVIVLVASQISRLLTDPAKPFIMSSWYVAQSTAFLATVRPGISFVAHVVYFGPVIILVALSWNRVCRFVHSAGIGLTMTLTYAFLLSLNSESRILINFMPVIAVLVAVVTVDSEWPTWRLVLLAGVSILWSKAWYQLSPDIGSLPAAFPAQSYFMNHGPWMSGWSYVLQGTGVLVSTVVLAWPARSSNAASLRDSEVRTRAA